jgi:hypothetical protein
MELRVEGTDLPGLAWGDPRPAGCRYENIHVGIQRTRDVEELVPGDAGEAVWDIAVEVTDDDFKGPHVQGKRGERFLYLSWGTVDAGGGFEMFRRAKLMLAAVDRDALRAADRPGRRLVGRLTLTGGDGGPRCAAVRPPAITWAAEET